MPHGNDRRLKVLVLDSDTDRAAVLGRRLRFLDYEPVIFDADGEFDADDGLAVVFGADDSDHAVHDAARRIRSRVPALPFLCLSGDSGIHCLADRLAGGVASGPTWALEKPLTRSQFERLLRRAERYRGQERRHRITGTSHPVRHVRALIEQVADFDSNVLVTGQSGTGKELVARTLHDLSGRSDQPFVPINCGAIPGELLESELFGHEKGAFTGAIRARTGRFELAEGGTLFLDEIGEMSLDMQVKLLRVLQERCFERVGSNALRHCDVRIVAATHVDLPAAVAKGEFREDLYYRLNVFPIEMPPLYRRLSDLPQLFDELLVARAGKSQGKLRLGPDALAVLASYRWPGNIRELSNLVERLAIMKPEGTIGVEDLPARFRNADRCAPPVASDEALPMVAVSLKDHLRSIEQSLIGQAMTASDGVVAKAARLLRLRRTTLVEKIGKYDLH